MTERNSEGFVNIVVNGMKYKVSSDLTIIDAMESVGYKFTRGVGCRQGMCGACATIYRLQDSYKLKTALACQELVEDSMHLFMVSFSPTKKAIYNIDNIKPSKQALIVEYPEIARCLSCNTCTKACPHDLEVMRFVQASIIGDFEEVSMLSFDCIDCGLCAIRCPAEIAPYLVARLARRIYARYVAGLSELVEKRISEVEDGTYDDELDEISRLDTQQIKELYSKRDFR
jgi:succinate dehydrogenase/fumarate reductase-like Fe-S protein